jgi:sugar phosphate isomerase/epimerase
MVWRIGSLFDFYDQIAWIHDNGFEEVSFWTCKGETGVWQGFDVLRAKEEEINRLRQSLKCFNMVDLHIGPIDTREIDSSLVSQDPEVRRMAIKLLETIFQFAREIKTNIITIHDGSGSELNRSTILSNLARSLRELDELAGKYGIRLGVEMAENLDFIQAADFHNVGLTFDTGHIAARQDMLAQGELIKALGKRIFHVHVHDYDGKYDHLPIGEGRLNFDEILNALLKTDYKRALCIELNPDRALPKQILESKGLLSRIAGERVGEDTS